MDMEIFRPGKEGLQSAWQTVWAALSSASDSGCAVLHP